MSIDVCWFTVNLMWIVYVFCSSYAVAGGMVVDNLEFLQIYEATAFLDESVCSYFVFIIDL